MDRQDPLRSGAIFHPRHRAALRSPVPLALRRSAVSASPASHSTAKAPTPALVRPVARSPFARRPTPPSARFDALVQASPLPNVLRRRMTQPRDQEATPNRATRTPDAPVEEEVEEERVFMPTPPRTRSPLRIPGRPVSAPRPGTLANLRSRKRPRRSINLVLKLDGPLMKLPPPPTVLASLPALTPPRAPASAPVGRSEPRPRPAPEPAVKKDETREDARRQRALVKDWRTDVKRKVRLRKDRDAANPPRRKIQLQLSPAVRERLQSPKKAGGQEPRRGEAAVSGCAVEDSPEVWTSEQVEALHEAVSSGSFVKRDFWRSVAAQVPGKDAEACSHRYFREPEPSGAREAQGDRELKAKANGKKGAKTKAARVAESVYGGGNDDAFGSPSFDAERGAMNEPPRKRIEVRLRQKVQLDLATPQRADGGPSPQRTTETSSPAPGALFQKRGMRGHIDQLKKEAKQAAAAARARRKAKDDDRAILFFDDRNGGVIEETVGDVQVRGRLGLDGRHVDVEEEGDDAEDDAFGIP